MNIYAFIPLVATVVYVPLLIVTFGSRPFGSQQRLFGVFLIATALWSLTDFVFRSNILPEHNLLLLRLIVIMFTWVIVQLHCFTSSFYPPNKSRWLPVAYISLAVVVVLVLLGFIAEDVTTEGGMLYPQYGNGIFVLFVLSGILIGRNIRVFRKMLENQKNPVIYNQIISLLLCFFFLAVFTASALLPFGREFPLPHIGNIILALILSYAVIGQRLVDIGIALRRGLIWLVVVVTALGGYWLLLLLLNVAFSLNVNLPTGFVAYIAALAVALLIYRLRNIFASAMGKALQGESYDYRQRLWEFANKIQNIFSLREQGGELLKLVVKAIGCKQAGLLFLDADGEAFVTQLVEPKVRENHLSSFRLKKDSPIAGYLRRERKPLTVESLSILPDFIGLWEREKAEIEREGLELFMPLISRDNLIGVLVLTGKQRGRYTLDDFSLMEDIASRVAVSMEKEYLREQLKEREEELSIINRSSAIITSSLDIQRIYDSFINELKKVVDVDWAAICLIEQNELYFLALSSDIGSAWKVGERIPIKGSATEWLVAYPKPVIEPDLAIESKFATGKYHIQQGIRSVAYLPLVVSNKVIGSLIVASRNPNVYGRRHLKLLEQLAAQIAMPIENSRLYAETARMARDDELTGLLNRRSLNEMLASEIGRHSRYGGVFSLIIIDLDSFKYFNDVYGHLAGDMVLKQAATIMKSSIRDADQAFRYGGDEFAILLPQTASEAASKVAERIRQQILAKVKLDSTPLTVSLGIATWPADGIGTSEIISAADAALYQAKRAGGNRAEFASKVLASSVTPMVVNKTPDSEALSTIFALAATVDARDHYTRSHSKKVSAYAVALAEALGLGSLEINRLGSCALLHDIGKIGINDEILKKQGKLSEPEWDAVKMHPQLGAAITSHSHQLSTCLSGIIHHHERYDGTGYPRGLKGDEIPMEARILAVADAFAAMTTVRSYSRALSVQEALDEMMRCSGTQFDPKLVEVFLSIAGKLPQFSQEGTEGLEAEK
ncbi:MAG: diguanylate cyclase [Dehalococcoidia bacterium]|nr:diguanylate cyclase [Dehalococcoidia bacterium]